MDLGNQKGNSEQNTFLNDREIINIPNRTIFIINLIGGGGIVGGIILIFTNFLFGAILLFVSTLVTWLINLLILVKRKITKEVLLIDLLCGSFMIGASILTQIISYLVLSIEKSSLNYFLITAPFFLGGFLIADSIRFYRRRTQVVPKGPPPSISSRLLFYIIFISISIFGIATFFLFVSVDPLMMFISALVVFLSMVPLSYSFRRYLRSIASNIDEKILEKKKKYVLIGFLADSALLILIFTLFLTESAVPPNILMGSILLVFQIFLFLFYILKYLYYQKRF